MMVHPTLKSQNQAVGPVYFSIPLRPWTNARAWSEVSSLLSDTIHSIRASDDARFHIVICGHEKPEFLKRDASNITFLEAPFDKPMKPENATSDKARKRRHIGAYVRQIENSNNSKIFFCDADDIIGRSVVNFINDSQSTAQIIDAGFRYDCATKSLELTQQGFYRRCGSSFSCRFYPDELPENWKDRNCFYSKLANHTKVIDVCEENGIEIEYNKNACVIYRINHEMSLEFIKKGMKKIKSCNQEIAQKMIESEFPTFFMKI